MPSFEGALEDGGTPTPVEDVRDRFDGVESGRAERLALRGDSAEAARVLELAARTADELVDGAQIEAESLVTTAQAKADAILDASRKEAHQLAAELSRSRREQTAELDRERATALAGMADEKAALESQIATLRQIQEDHRREMHRYLTRQLELLDRAVPEALVADLD